MLCFVDAEWPFLGGPTVVDGIVVLWPNQIRDFVFRNRSLDQDAIDQWHRVLGSAFKPA
jgi:hypothetical protein